MTALFFILLIFWVFILQNRITKLEKLVATLKDTNLHESQHITTQEADHQVHHEKHNEIPITNIENFQSNVETFKKTHSAPANSKLYTLITNYFTQGNILVRIGGIILFFGLTFLVKYVSENSIISLQVRLVSIAFVAIIILIIGWKLKNKEGAYGLILQGLGVSMLYLVIFTASKFYALLSLDIAFGFMLLVVLFGSFLAIKQNALPLALFSTTGGFLVPILTSSGDGSHILLFSYYVLLNVGVLIVAWYKSWRLLNITSFLFTFIIGAIWGVLRFQTEFFISTQPFLIVFFLMYLTISILYTLKHSFNTKNFVDSTLVFGLPLAAFPLQVSLTETFPYGASYSAITLGALYTLLFNWLKNKEQTQLLSQAFLALGVVFFTIAIPYMFDADVSAALWSLESSALIWISLKQHHSYGRYFGSALLLLSVGVYVANVGLFSSHSLVHYLGYLIIIASTLLVSYLLDKRLTILRKFEHRLPSIFLALSIFLWLMSTTFQLKEVTLPTHQAFLLSLTLGAIWLFFVTKWLNWERPIGTLQLFLPLGMSVFSLHTLDSISFSHPLEDWAKLIVSGFLALNYFFLSQFNTVWRWIKPLHILSLVSLVFILTVELYYHANLWQIGRDVPAIALVISPLLFSFGLLSIKHYPHWLQHYQKEYQLYGVGILVLFIMFWEAAAFSIAPDFNLLPYIPLLNPLDLTQLLGLCVVTYWLYFHKNIFNSSNRTLCYGVLIVMSFLFITIVLARFIHHSQAIVYTLPSIWQNIYFQTSLSVLWSLIAIGLMFLSKRYSHRLLWMAGFGLLLIVVLKLFFVELANSGTIERIISFIVVGTLLLLIGYFVPMPPRNSENLKDAIPEPKELL